MAEQPAVQCFHWPENAIDWPEPAQVPTRLALPFYFYSVPQPCTAKKQNQELNKIMSLYM